jgi:hypothetical protein
LCTFDAILQYPQDNRKGLEIRVRVLLIRKFEDLLEEIEVWKTGDRVREEGDEIAFPDARIGGNGLDEAMVGWVTFQFCVVT